MNAPLPEPFGYLEPTGRSPAFHFLRREHEDGMPVFSADQMLAYGRACREAGMRRLTDEELRAVVMRGIETPHDISENVIADAMVLARAIEAAVRGGK